MPIRFRNWRLFSWFIEGPSHEWWLTIRLEREIVDRRDSRRQFGSTTERLDPGSHAAPRAERVTGPERRNRTSERELD